MLSGQFSNILISLIIIHPMQKNGFRYHYVEDNSGAFDCQLDYEGLTHHNLPEYKQILEEPAGKEIANIILKNPGQTQHPASVDEWPNSCIGLLFIQYQKNAYLGIASLVSCNIALTCAHILRKQKEEPKFIYLFMGVNQKYGRCFKVKKFSIPKAYKDDPKKWDFALLTMQNNIGDEYGYLGINLTFQDELMMSTYSSYTHFAYRTPKGNSHQKILIETSETLYAMKQNQNQPLHGSPIILKQQFGCKIVGVYIGGLKKIQYLNQTHRSWLSQIIRIQKGQIDLNYKKIGDQGLVQLVQDKWVKLQKLHLRSCNITEKGADAFAHLKAEILTHLVLAYNYLGNNLRGLIRASIPNLQSLDLLDNRIGDEGVAYLVKSNWPKLQWLILSRNYITNDGRSQFSKCNWPNLYLLSLDKNSIQSKNGAPLIRLPWNKPMSLSLDYPIRPVQARDALSRKVHATITSCFWMDK